MNKDLIKHADKLKEELETYFNAPKGQRSDYSLQKDFHPGVLGHANPTQLHETARHSTGGYVHTEMCGAPALRHEITAMVDNSKIPHWVMAEAMDHLRHKFAKWHDALSRIAFKGRHTVREEIWLAIPCSERSLDRWEDEAYAEIADYLVQYYSNNGSDAATIARREVERAFEAS